MITNVQILERFQSSQNRWNLWQSWKSLLGVTENVRKTLGQSLIKVFGKFSKPSNFNFSWSNAKLLKLKIDFQLLLT